MFDKICLILAIVGCLNWGLVGLFSFDLVAWIFGGTDAILSRINRKAVFKQMNTAFNYLLSQKL